MAGSPAPVLGATPTPPRPPALSRRASLNTAAAGVDYGARLLVELVVTPLLVSGLGSYLYGVWRVLWQWTGYTWAASGRSAQALHSAVAHHQSSGDLALKRQLVGSAVAVWALFLPLLAAVGGLGVWLAPIVLDTPPDQVGTVRLAATVLVVDSLALTLLTVPRSVLQGENLGYKRLGVSALVVLLGGGLQVAAVRLGLGLPGVAGATLVTTVLTAAVFLRVTRRHVPWFGIARPPRATFRWFLGLSSWFIAWKVVFELMTASDLLILAGLASVDLVTAYVLTKFAADAFSTVMLTLAQGTTPGLGGILGQGDLVRAARLRAEMLAFVWWAATSTGVTIIVWNASFVELWVGEDRFAGPVANLLLVVLVVQLVLFRSDSYLIDVTLTLRDKVRMGAVSTALSIALAAVLVGVADLGVVGLCLGLLAGRTVLSVASPLIVGRALRLPVRRQVVGSLRPAATTAVLFAVAFALGSRLDATGWLGLVGACLVTVAVAGAVAALAGLSSAQRRAVARRLATVVGRVR